MTPRDIVFNCQKYCMVLENLYGRAGAECAYYFILVNKNKKKFVKQKELIEYMDNNITYSLFGIEEIKHKISLHFRKDNNFGFIIDFVKSEMKKYYPDIYKNFTYEWVSETEQFKLVFTDEVLQTIKLYDNGIEIKNNIDGEKLKFVDGLIDEFNFSDIYENQLNGEKYIFSPYDYEKYFKQLRQRNKTVKNFSFTSFS